MPFRGLNESFAFYGSLLAFKTLILIGLTIVRRIKYKAFCKQGPHPEVESIRRCHLNDLENIVPFLFLGMIYLKTNPSTSIALWHFRIFTLSRLFHTPAYLLTDGPYTRGPIFMAGYAVNLSLALQCMAYFW